MGNKLQSAEYYLNLINYEKAYPLDRPYIRRSKNKILFIF